MILVPTILNGWYHASFLGAAGMSIRFIGKFAIIFTTFATNVIYAQGKRVVCPSIPEIRQTFQTIGDAFYYEGTYSLSASDKSRPGFKTRNIFWYVIVNDISAGSSDQAIEIAKAYIRNTSIKHNKYADEMKFGAHGEWNLNICKYGPAVVTAVGVDMTHAKDEQPSSDSSPTKRGTVPTPFKH